jgi:hypothetical protein
VIKRHYYFLEYCLSSFQESRLIVSYYILSLLGASFSIYNSEDSHTIMSRIRNFLKTRKRGYLWVTLSFFVMSLAIHWTFAWFAYVQEQVEHNQAIEVSGYFNQTLRDSMENWQSEFLQLMWQVRGLSFCCM